MVQAAPAIFKSVARFRVAQIRSAERAAIDEVEEILIGCLDPIQFVGRQIGDATAEHRADAVVGCTTPAAFRSRLHPAFAKVDRGDAGPFDGIGHAKLGERGLKECYLVCHAGVGSLHRLWAGDEAQLDRGIVGALADHAVGFQSVGGLKILGCLVRDRAEAAIDGQLSWGPAHDGTIQPPVDEKSLPEGHGIGIAGLTPIWCIAVQYEHRRSPHDTFATKHRCTRSVNLHVTLDPNANPGEDRPTPPIPGDEPP